jgi:hypothetical protein
MPITTIDVREICGTNFSDCGPGGRNSHSKPVYDIPPSEHDGFSG